MIKAKWWNKRKASYQGGSKPLLKKRRVVSDKPDTEVTKVNKKQFDKPDDPVDEVEVEVQNTVEKEEEVINPVDELLSIFDEAKKKAARKKLATESRTQKDDRKAKRKRK